LIPHDQNQGGQSACAPCIFPEGIEAKTNITNVVNVGGGSGNQNVPKIS